MDQVSPLPHQLITKLTTIFGAQTEHVLATFSEPKPLCVRINTLITPIEVVHDQLQQDNILFDLIDCIPEALLIHTDKARLMAHPLYTNGSLYIQGLSSQLATVILDPHPEETIFDLAAAPGSKTSHIAARMKNRGSLIANDLSRQRVFKLKANLEALGVNNTTVFNQPGQFLWKQFPSIFDRVLIDVPCSMEGRIRIDDPSTYEEWSQRKVKELSERQKGLLRSAYRACRIGGTIVYSTCTFSPEENEEVVDWLLTKERGNVEVLPIDLSLPETFPPVMTIGKHICDPSIAQTLRLMPSSRMEGFYIAKLRKIA